VIPVAENILLRNAILAIRIDECDDIIALYRSPLANLVCDDVDRFVHILKYSRLGPNEANDKEIIKKTSFAFGGGAV